MPLLLLVAVILEEHRVLPRLSPDLVQRLLKSLLLGGDAIEFSSIRIVQFLIVFAQLSLAAVERLALLPQFAHFRLVVDLMLTDQVLLLDQPLLVSQLLLTFWLAGDRLRWRGHGGE